MILKIKFTTRQVNSSSRGLNQGPFSRKKLSGHAVNQHFKIQLHLWNGEADPSSKLSS